jgi:hypothetical protein
MIEVIVSGNEKGTESGSDGSLINGLRMGGCISEPFWE